MASVSNLKEKYVLVIGKSLGLRASDFIRLTYGDFRKLDLNQEPPIFLGEISTTKEGINAFPFLDSDAVEIIKLLLESNKDKADSERVLKIRKKELSVILRRLAKKSWNSNGKRKNTLSLLEKILNQPAKPLHE